MSDWVEEKMKRWGEFSAGREIGAIGYPRMSPTFRVEASGGSGNVDIVDVDILRIDMLMAHFREAKPEWYFVGRHWYVFNEPVSTIARKSSCHRDTVYSRINALKAAVDKGLSKK